MIAEFSVSNFRSIREEQRISFIANSDELMSDEYCCEVAKDVNLLKIGIIYGANASGKSNILKALEFFDDIVCNMPGAKTDKIPYTRFLMDDHSSDEHTRMSMTFYLEREKYVLSVELDNDRIYKESLSVYTSKKPTLLYNREYNAEQDASNVMFNASLRLQKQGQGVIIGNTINNCTVMAAFGRSNVPSSKLNHVYDFFANHVADMLTPSVSLSELTKTQLREDRDGSLKLFLLRFLKASDFNISDIKLWNGSSASSEIVFMHKTDNGSYEMGETLESSGTIRYMGIAVLLNQLVNGNTFMSIDEIETSLHYELVAYFIKAFLANSEGTSQMLFTTHDINLLNENFIRRDVVWFTYKDSEESTTLTRLSSMGLRKALSPYHAYMQGKLIPMPFIASPYFELNINTYEKTE